MRQLVNGLEIKHLFLQPNAGVKKFDSRQLPLDKTSTPRQVPAERVTFAGCLESCCGAGAA
jgi:hypothetical protein